MHLLWLLLAEDKAFNKNTLHAMVSELDFKGQDWLWAEGMKVILALQWLSARCFSAPVP